MRYKNPSSTSTIIIEDNDEVLLVKRKRKPYRNKWALPGGFINYGQETLEQTAIREGKEETGYNITDLVLFEVNSHPKRDPRRHVIDHVYIIKKYSGEGRAGDDAKAIKRFSLYDMPKKLAFDHSKVMENYKKWKIDKQTAQ
jgi:8-oxo-dGTP diphosphatase